MWRIPGRRYDRLGQVDTSAIVENKRTYVVAGDGPPEFTKPSCLGPAKRPLLFMQKSRSIVGTWRLRTYEVWSDQGQVSSPLGDLPIGYAVFDGTGHAFVQLAKDVDPETWSSHDEAAGKALADSFTGYFGTYTVSPDRTKLTIQVQGSNRAAYIGSTQERIISVAADTLTMGQPNQYRAVLYRQPA